MSGGFFRGTSADQDTRFSNKQAKLLKSQKFASELEHMVDMTKVKMDVMRPWIANRVTELIGFEDEVLINFIYGLLDGKEVNGKEVQISLTGFMERNTGKFMKELWLLLLSAQKNASGVPQQFLDAKEEETKKKKAESDRIANEIQRRKEKESRELEQERNEKMDRGYILKDVDSGVEPSSKHEQRPSVARSVEEKEPKDKDGARGQSRVSKSPHSANRSSPRGVRSRSISKSFSNSRSYSGERRRSRSLSASNKRRGRSSSSERIHRYSPQRSLTHGRRSPRRSYSPSRRSFYSRRRSSSRSRHRSPSPTRYRMRRRSRSPLRRRSRSPFWRRPRSPTRRFSPWNRSRSPIHRRSSSVQRKSPSAIQRKSPSPARYRSPSPVRQKYRGSRSPIRRRSRSPIWRRSRSPIRRRSRSPIRHRSRSPVRGRLRSPIRRRSSSPIRHKSRSPVQHNSVSPSGSRSPKRSPRLANHKSPSSREWSSASPVRRRSPSPVGRRSPKTQRRSPLQSPRGRNRGLEKRSPVHDTVPRNAVERLTDTHQRSRSLARQSDSWDRNDSHRKLKRLSRSPQRSPVSEAERETSLIEKRSVKTHHSHSPNPSRKAREKRLHNETSETSADEKEIYVGESTKMRENSSAKISSPDQHKLSHIEDHENVTPQRFNVHHPVQTQSRAEIIELKKKDQVLPRGNKSERLEHQTIPGQQDSQKIRDTLLSEKKKESPIKVRNKAGEKNQSHSDDTKLKDRHLENLPKLSRKVQNGQSPSLGSDSEESDKNRAKVKDKRKNKRSGRREVESDEESSYDSYAEERKEAKRRRREEKRIRKEERRRRRQEKRRRKEERREGKQKLKSGGTLSTPSDTDGKHDDHFGDDQAVKRQESGQGDMDEPLTEQKKLEIELREKAIELYMAKKGISH